MHDLATSMGTIFAGTFVVFGSLAALAVGVGMLIAKFKERRFLKLLNEVTKEP